jgi:hypothetical protein
MDILVYPFQLCLSHAGNVLSIRINHYAPNVGVDLQRKLGKKERRFGKIYQKTS